TDQDSPRAVAVEPLAGSVEVVLADPEQPTPSPESRLTAVTAHCPGDVAAGNVASRTGKDDACQVESGAGHGSGCQRPAERHDEFGWHRYARGFRNHQQEDRQIAIGRYEVLHRFASFRRGIVLATLWVTARSPGR